MTETRLAKMMRAIAFRERLLKSLPGIRGKILDVMDEKGIDVLVAGGYKAIKSNGSIDVLAMPNLDPNQLELFEKDDKGLPKAA